MVAFAAQMEKTMLNNKQKSFLKSQAHHLKPIITVGNAGMTESLLKETRKALEHHELLKIKLPATNKENKSGMAQEFCEQCSAELVQLIGRVIVIYRQSKEPVIKLPKI